MGEQRGGGRQGRCGSEGMRQARGVGACLILPFPLPPFSLPLSRVFRWDDAEFDEYVQKREVLVERSTDTHHHHQQQPHHHAAAPPAATTDNDTKQQHILCEGLRGSRVPVCDMCVCLFVLKDYYEEQGGKEVVMAKQKKMMKRYEQARAREGH